MVQTVESGKAHRVDLFIATKEGREQFEGKLQGRIEHSIKKIVSAQHPQTGLFPAATEDHCVLKDHYGHSWVRDDSFIILALLDPFLAQVSPQGIQEAYATGLQALNGMYSLFAKEPWYSSFRQEISEKTDEQGRLYTQLTKEAPPIHIETNGEVHEWPTQNQPDAWGEFLIATVTALEQGAFSFTPKQQETFNAIVGYLVGLNVAVHEQFSMWEWDGVHVAPISTMAIVGEGLERSTAYVSNRLLREYLRRTVRSLKDRVVEEYPTDNTVAHDHISKTDAATMLGIRQHAFDGIMFSRYFLRAFPELRNGHQLGWIRFKGDLYYTREGKEPLWPLFALEASSFYLEHAIDALQRGDKMVAEVWGKKGLHVLSRVTAFIDEVGYTPELLVQGEDGNLIPNDNHLLWTEASLMQACARALVFSRLHNLFYTTFAEDLAA